LVLAKALPSNQTNLTQLEGSASYNSYELGLIASLVIRLIGLWLVIACHELVHV